jgi:LmbE family N-acetylglucosaminyl deacetylase
MDNRPYRHVLLSPHLDDAVLSCGGTIHHWSTAGEAVLVVTFMTGDPPVGELSPFAEYQHARWHLPAGKAYPVRRAEEAAALQLLGADYCHLGFLDCIYRGDRAGFYYASEEALFGPVHPADEPLVDALLGRLADLEPFSPSVVAYAPLALGGHVDHQLVRRAAGVWHGVDLLYYEDYPYAARVGEVTKSRRGSPVPLALSAADMQAKIEAIGRYRSQIGVLFGDYSQMEASVWRHGRRSDGKDGWEERFWRIRL